MPVTRGSVFRGCQDLTRFNSHEFVLLLSYQVITRRHALQIESVGLEGSARGVIGLAAFIGSKSNQIISYNVEQPETTNPDSIVIDVRPRAARAAKTT